MLIFVDYHKEKMNYYKLVSRIMERFTEQTITKYIIIKNK